MRYTTKYVKVRCTECEGKGRIEYIHDPPGGYGPMHLEPDYRERECDSCAGEGYVEMTRAELLARNLARVLVILLIPWWLF